MGTRVEAGDPWEGGCVQGRGGDGLCLGGGSGSGRHRALRVGGGLSKRVEPRTASSQDGTDLLFQTDGTLRAGWVCGVKDCMQPGEGGGCRGMVHLI